MKSALALLLVSLLFQEKAPIRNTWAGFPDGSWVVIETTESADAKTSKKRHRHEVDHLADGAVVCQVSEESDVPAIFFEERTIQPGRGVEEGSTKAARSDSETVEIGGRKIACVTASFHDNNADGKQGATLWTTKEFKVPYREWDPAELTVTPGRIVHSGGTALALDPNVLRYRMTHHAGDGSGRVEAHEFRIVEVDHKLKVADREIACAVEEGTIEEKGPKGATTIALKRWLSDAVPGRVVRSEMRGEVRGVKVERVRQVLSFKVAR